MSLSELHGHASAIDGLWRAAADGHLAHALLFRGPFGIGKFLAMRHLACGLVCVEGPGPPCGTCGPCKRFLSGNHPDVFVIDAAAHAQEAITIHFISHRDDRPKDGYRGQALEDFLALKAQEGGFRIVLIREAERMNEAAQNALLKTLEEPASGTLLLLETSQPASLLSTISSRVVTVDLVPLAREETLGVLRAHLTEKDDVELLSRMARGAPGRAVQLAERGAPAMRALWFEVARGERDGRGASDKVWEVDGEFPGKTARASARARARAFLDLGLDALRDLERFVAGADAADLAHGDLVPDLVPVSLPRRRWCQDEWLRARQDLELNLAPEGLVERALYALEPDAVLARGKR